MSAKILVADDSITIQKVINITLKNYPFEVVESLNESDLMTKIKNHKFDLILLDFTLSAAKTGYELIRQISTISAGTPVVVMLGTFDTYNENSIKESGAADKIVKPFDGQKFIEICKRLTNLEHAVRIEEEFDVEDIEDDASEPPIEKVEEVKTEDRRKKSKGDEDITKEIDLKSLTAVSEQHNLEEQDEDEENEGWFVSNEVTNSSNVKGKTLPALESVSVNTNPLSKELEDWGMSIPGVIGAEEVKGEEVPARLSVIQSEIPQAVLPKNTDLDFPDLEAFSRGKIGLTESIPAKQSAPRLVPLSDLANDEDENETNGGRQDLTLEIKMAPNRDLENEINSELKNDDFWKADEIVASNGQIEEQKVEKIKIEEKVPLTSPSTNNIEINDEMIEKIKASLTPLIEKMVKEFCKQTIENVAWEVIPDLAENIIKKEIEQISKEL